MRGVGPAGLVHIVCRKHEILSLVPRKPVAHMRHALTVSSRSPPLVSANKYKPGRVPARQVRRAASPRAWPVVRPCRRRYGSTFNAAHPVHCRAIVLPRAEEARAFTEPRSEARQHESHAADGLPTCRAQRAILANKPHV